MSFASLNLIPELLRAVEAQGYTEPTPIQAKAIPAILEGRDIMGCAQTGTGKTASFTLPLLQLLAPHASSSSSPARHPVRALVLVPTRELAAQVEESVRTYSKYLPLRASHFKDEVVASITEINGYLIAFFRGQLIVSLINGTVTGIALAAAGLEFGILVGFALCFLGIIPYIGIILCWIPAVIIASVQGGSWLVRANAAWWVFPVVVTGIFTVVQQVDGLFVTPKIVGERVGLHPVTVIFSVFLWSLLLGGLLGAILAVPLTATAKVILKRYIWERTIMAEIPPTFGDSPISDK